MTKEQKMLRRIKKAVDKIPFIEWADMTVNELLFAMTQDNELKDAFLNVQYGRNGEVAFGYVNGFWPVRHRALKVVQYGVWFDDETENYAIEIAGEEVNT